MSELKAVHAFDVYEAYTKTGDDDAAQVYLKSEADKVIAELQSKVTLASLADDCSYLRNKRCNYCSELQRQKYKRCLAMAEWCDAEADVADADGDYEDMLWYQKWHERWLKLAEKFKPNN